ncbi:hypothetical protein GCM10011390_05070 [Aureimonas endophytica]|uniref:Glyoxalase-like domain-containing protein n=1 Tax=Aureimonas endophytica TaxID=2027858 RepID=A0A916ZDL4_9HYPH|nr:VOC family protein [Aureimonas endophytica]GGD89267.1 hypothetical protein GCM10011390_05070 [Aureimonas endophytica]
MRGGRDLDHVVMPVADLGSARELLTGLGFTVAPEASHPFGSGNACVFFADGSYLEPLALLDRDLAETRAAEGNAFLRRDIAYRLRHPLPAFTGVAIRSADALADRDTFSFAGFDGGEILEFGRPFTGPDGRVIDLSFRLAFAAERAAPETFVFACQRLFDFALDRSALTRHPNRVTGIAHLVFAADEPDRFRGFLEAVLRCESEVINSLGFSAAIGNARIEVLTPDGLAARYGTSVRAESGLRLVGLLLETEALETVGALAPETGRRPTEILGRLVVPIGDESGIFLAFETRRR